MISLLTFIASICHHFAFFSPPKLFLQSQSVLGFDFCEKGFKQGAYIFEDTFEAWVQGLDVNTNLMQSAMWDIIVNGQTSDFCGVGEPSPFGGGGLRALSFSGLEQRYAQTKPLDVTSGGWIEAEVLLAPEGFQETHPLCPVTYIGVVNLEYSIEYGATWTMIKAYEPPEYRTPKFFFIKEDIPLGAMTAATSFRFKQPAFVGIIDAWALDNVRVFRYFPNYWDSTSEYRSQLADNKKRMERASCCFDTERCEKRLSESEWALCESIQGFKKGQSVLRSTEIFVIMVLAINILKFTYVSIMNWYIRKAIPFSEEYRALVSFDLIMRYIPAQYRPKKDISSLVNDIHSSARLVGALRDELKDNDEVDIESLRLKEVEKAERKKRKKLKMKRKKKLGYSDTEAAYDSSDEDEDLRDQQNANEKEVEVADGLEKLKRQNVAMLRIPFDIKVDYTWRYLFLVSSCSVFAGIFLAMAILIQPNILYQRITSFGSMNSTMYIASTTIGFYAFICTFRV